MSKGLQKGYKKTTKGLQREFSFEKGAVVSDVAIHSSALQIVTYFLSIERNDSDNSVYRGGAIIQNLMHHFIKLLLIIFDNFITILHYNYPNKSSNVIVFIKALLYSFLFNP